MTSILNPLPESEINNTQSKYEEYSKLGKFKNQPFPIQGIQNNRDFERLGFYLFKNLSKVDSNSFDTVWLMPEVKDGGRDILLRKSGVTAAIVQCKKYSSKITLPQLLREITILVLQNKDHTILNGQNVIDYHLMTTIGVTEPAKTFIDQLNSKHFELPEDKIQDAIESIISEKKFNTALFKSRSMNDNVNHISMSLRSLIISVIDSEKINDLLEKDIETAKKFFRIDPVIDRSSFVSILNEREAQSLRQYNEKSYLEKELEQRDKGLSDILTRIKQKSEVLFNDHEISILAYCDHKKAHSQWMLQIASSMLGANHQLNSDELFILVVSLSLSDIGVCQPLFSLDKLLVNKNHHELSSNYIKEFGTDLEIPPKYIYAIATTVLATNGSLIHPESRFSYLTDYSAEPFSVNKINLLYIATIVWLADIIDLQNLTSESLLHAYHQYPNYGLSNSIWDGTDYMFNCNVVDQTLILKAHHSIDNQLIYLGLHKKIESIRVLIQTANSILSKEGKSFRLKFVSDELKSVFKRQIGISVDANNILTTLLGKKLYAKETDAIREIIQNALDACTYSKASDPLHKSRIDVQFESGKLKVQDNGIGMDEEIVTNFFAKAGRSYHTELLGDKVIGRFGIGVFSYFMLGASFVVETRKKNSEALKFKVDQESPEMFYFFDDGQIPIGTSITFEYLAYSINHFDLKEYLSIVFKYANSPIYLNGVLINVIEDVPLNDNAFLIKENIKIEHQRYFLENFNSSTVRIDNDEMTGWAGIFMPNKLIQGDIRQKFRKGFKYYNKGIFVTGESNLIGEINLKKGLPLKLDRNSFEKTTDYDRVRDYILKEVYTAAIKNLQILAPHFTHFFIHNYGGGHADHTEFYTIHDHLFPFTFQNGNFQILSLKQISGMQRKVELLTFTNNFSFEFTAKRSSNTTSLVIPVVSISSDKFYSRYFKNLNYDEGMSHDESASYYTFNPNKTISLSIPHDAEVRQCEFIQFDDNLLCTFFAHDTFFNVNNELIRFYFYSCENPELIAIKRALNQLLAEIGNILLNAFADIRGTSKHGSARVLLFNERLKEIFKQIEFSYEITRNDFPLWMQKYIID